MKVLLIFFLFLSVSLLPAQSISLNTADTSPYSSEEGDGFYDILLTEIFNSMGYELKINHYPSERSLQWADDGHDDGEFARISGMSKSYSNLLKLEESLVDFNFVAITREGFSEPVKSWDDLKELRVAYLNGWKIYENNVGRGENITVYNDVESLFKVLLGKRVDVILYSELRAEEYMAANGIRDLRILDPPLKTRTMHLYLNRKHAALVEPFNRELKQLKESGRYDQIAAEYLKK